MKHMTILIPFVLFAFVALSACPKKGVDPAPDNDPVAQTPESTPEPTPEPTPPPPTPEPATDDGLEARSVTIVLRDGTTMNGSLTRVAMSDRFGEAQWQNNPNFDITAGTTLKSVTMGQVQSMTSTAKSISDADINCTYDSAATPVTIECSFKTPMDIRLSGDTNRYKIDNKDMWRFYLDGSLEKRAELHLGAIYLKKSTGYDVLDDLLLDDARNAALQVELQDELKEIFKVSVKSITFK